MDAEQFKIRVHVRWMIRRDMQPVLAIENKSFDFPWSESDFVLHLRQRNCIGMVAEWDDRVVGFMVYELHRHRLTLLNFAVDPHYRRRGVGQQMVEKLTNKLSAQRRVRITTQVRESNLDGQLFFARHGFRATTVLRDFYDDNNEDAYLFQYRLREEAMA